jgi:4-carboxymuconolactone decarboxylase
MPLSKTVTNLRKEKPMARIPLLTPESMTAEQRRVHDNIVQGPRGKLVGPLRAALHNPELAEKWQQVGALLRYGTHLPPRLSELAILITARHWDCQFEWFAHEPPAQAAGIAQSVIDAIKHHQRPALEAADEQAVYDYVTQLHQTRFVSEAVYQRALDLFGVVAVVDLTALVGYYAMVAMTLNAHELPLPEGTAPPLPPRAVEGKGQA